MNISKAINLELGVGRYDGAGNLFFETNMLYELMKFGILAQIEFLETLQDSLQLSEGVNNSSRKCRKSYTVINSYQCKSC